MDPQGWREQLRLMSFEDLREMISRKLNDYESTDPEDKTVALFRALSDWAPSEEGRRNVAIDILTCSTDDCLRTVAERYRIGLILPSEVFFFGPVRRMLKSRNFDSPSGGRYDSSSIISSI